MPQIKFDPKVIENSKVLDKAAAKLQVRAFKYLLIAFGIYFMALSLTIASLIPSWLMYLVTTGTIITIWVCNRLTGRAMKMQRASFELVNDEMMRIARLLK